jgi:hypothetical protein
MPALQTHGLITLEKIGTAETVTVTHDPADYDPLDWPTRMSTHKLIGGGRATGTVRQVRGRFLSDLQVHIATGPTQWWNKALVQTLLAWQQDLAATYRMQDGEGNEFVVVIDAFHPEPVYGLEGLYTASLELGVIEIEALLGQPYTGV